MILILLIKSLLRTKTSNKTSSDSVNQVLRGQICHFADKARRTQTHVSHAQLGHDKRQLRHTPPLTSSSPFLSASVILLFPLTISSSDFLRAAFSRLYFSRSFSGLELPDFKPHLPIIISLAVLELIVKHLQKTNVSLRSSNPFRQAGRDF